jgi:signal transduction histidine kinase
MGLQENWRSRLRPWPQWPQRFSLVPGLLALLIFGAAALVDATSGASPRDFADGVPGNYVVLQSARWLDLGPEEADAPSLSPLPAAVMEARGVSVALPHRLSKDMARASIGWYSMALTLPAVAPGTPASGVCVPRWSSSASVWLDGKQLVASATGVHGMHDWSRPQYIGLPPELSSGTHRLDLRLRALPALAPGLSEIWFGDGPLIRRACEALAETREQRIIGSGLMIGMIGLAGLGMALLLRDPSAGWFAMMALLWVAQLMIARGAGASLAEQNWTLLYFATRTAFVVPMLMFCLRFSKSVRPTVEQVMLLAYSLALVVLLLLPPEYWARWLTTVAIALLLGVPYFLVILLRHALRRPTISAALLVAAVGIVLLTSALDVMRWLSLVPFSNASLSIMAMPLLSFAFGTLLIERLVGFTRNEIGAAEMLRLTVARQSEQLAANYAELKEQGERLVVLEERRRIARDMHDGVGAHLASVSAMLKGGPALEQAHMAGLVDAALHELRGVLDVLSAQPALHDDDDPVSTLLGLLRWRIGPVLESQGIVLAWEAETLPADFLPGDAARLQLIRLLQEAFTNIVKHARADTVQFRSCADREAIWIEVTDDGVGMPAAAAPARGLGLAGMHQRAAALGATLEIADGAPGTRVSLRFER